VSRKTSLRIILATLTGVVLFGAMGAVFCAATLHVSRKLETPPASARTVSVIAPAKAKLSAWWMKPTHPNGNCVAILHDISDSRVGSAGFAPMFLNAGYAVLLPDSRGHGASEGQYVTYGLLEKYDVIAWSDWLKSARCGKLRFGRIAGRFDIDLGRGRSSLVRRYRGGVPLCRPSRGGRISNASNVGKAGVLQRAGSEISRE
jgi:hypothetical protein